MKNSSTNKLKSQLVKIFWITLIWTLISVFQFLRGYFSLKEFSCDLKGLEPIFFFKGSILTGILAGLLGGSSIVFIWEKWLRSKNYGVALFGMFWSYSIIYLMVSIVTGFYINGYELGLGISDIELWRAVMSNLVGFEQFLNFTTWLIITLGTLIALQVKDKYGPGVFRSFILGKYFQPTREERIFMFLDLRSSTSIAERLGEERYFTFIKNVFKDVTPAIIYSKGEIYQYVGDEIVISWKIGNGIKDANCIQCFFEVQSALIQKKDFYQSTFDGIIPEFKAGLHYGHVMAGEVGVVKRDIAFSGDVLNSTSRIQSMCNELGVNILFSGNLLKKLMLKPNLFNPKRIGEMELRGKEEKLMLFTV